MAIILRFQTGSVIGRGVARITIRRGVARNASTKGAPVIGNAVKQSSEGVCTWIASGCAFAMTMRNYFVIKQNPNTSKNLFFNS
jgi:hypothetical protein